MYAASVLHCLPVGRQRVTLGGHRHRHAPRHLRRPTHEAPGSRRVDILPIEHDLFRFYQLIP